MNMELNYGLLKSRSFNLNTGGHISVGNCRKYGVSDDMDYANMALGNPFDDTAIDRSLELSIFGQSGSEVSIDPPLSDEREIKFHAIDLDPVDTLNPVGCSEEEWLDSLIPSGLSMVDKNELIRLLLPQQHGGNETVLGLASPTQVTRYERAEPTEDAPNIDSLTIENSAAVSPCQSTSDLSESDFRGRKQKLLWGENGLLGLPEDVASRVAPRKSGLIRGMTKKLKHQLAEIVDESNKGFMRKSSSAMSPSAPGSSAASLVTSLDTTTQAKLYSELEVMICNVANGFILQQYYDGRVSQHSINKVNAAWNAKNNHHVVEFRFDQATQRDLILANRRCMEFTGDASRFPIRLQTNLQNWKKIAHEMSIRTFCLPDSAIRKHFFDIRQIIDMMDPSLETLRAFQDLTAWTNDQMLDKETAARRQSEARRKRGF